MKKIAFIVAPTMREARVFADTRNWTREGSASWKRNDGSRVVFSKTPRPNNVNIYVI